MLFYFCATVSFLCYFCATVCFFVLLCATVCFPLLRLCYLVLLCASLCYFCATCVLLCASLCYFVPLLCYSVGHEQSKTSLCDFITSSCRDSRVLLFSQLLWLPSRRHIAPRCPSLCGLCVLLFVGLSVFLCLDACRLKNLVLAHFHPFLSEMGQNE